MLLEESAWMQCVLGAQKVGREGFGEMAASGKKYEA